MGFSNFVLAVQDTVFQHSFWYTALFTVVSVIVIKRHRVRDSPRAHEEAARNQPVPHGVLHAQPHRRHRFEGYIWQLIFNGILAQYSQALSLNEWYGFAGLVILVAWQQIGYMMIIYIAGLQSIPGDVLEAAAIDGASAWRQLIDVTIPMMMSSITICMFLSLTNGFKLFDQNLSLTAGEPSKMSEMLALNIYNTFYGRVGWEGVGQAKAVIFCLIVVGIGLIQLRATRSREVQQ